MPRCHDCRRRVPESEAVRRTVTVSELSTSEPALGLPVVGTSVRRRVALCRRCAAGRDDEPAPRRAPHPLFFALGIALGMPIGCLFFFAAVAFLLWLSFH